MVILFNIIEFIALNDAKAVDSKVSPGIPRTPFYPDFDLFAKDTVFLTPDSRVRTRDTLNLYLKWGTPYKVAPRLTESCWLCTLYKLFLQEIT